jgi:amino acid adenylation domain-containing protein/non-ribosomal peptide synthase protein (TIGR01720 family)
MAQQGIEGFQLSPQQQRVWLLQQATPQPVYKARCSIHIEGDLNVAALSTAISRVVARHEILRMVFQRLPGMALPLQVITDHPARVEILQTQEQGKEDAALETTSGESILYPLASESGPSLKFSLSRVSSEKHLLSIELPALCADARTLHNLTRDIVETYSADVKAQEQPEQLLQYVDFAEWQNELLHSDDAAEGHLYWQQRWSAASSSTRLPGLRAGGSHARFAPRHLPVPVEPQLSRQIEEAARACAVSSDMFVLACWYLLLWRLSDKAEVMLGVANDGRGYAELPDALGLFAKFLPLSQCLTSGMSFKDYLALMAEAIREMEDWQEVFDWARLTSSTSLLDDPPYIAYGFETLKRPAFQTSDKVSFIIARQEVCFERFDLKLTCQESDGAFDLLMHYNADVCDEAAIVRLCGQLQTLLESASAGTETAIERLNVLSAGERRLMLFEWNATQTPYPSERCFQHLFEEQAARTPDELAVLCGTQQLTYRELDERSNQLAYYLRARGVHADSIVGICMERSPELIVALLGVLKAGGAYLPLDPRYPSRRLEFMLEDARVPVLLTQAHLVASLPVTQAELVSLDADWATIAGSHTGPLVTDARPENLAYVIYTSGSTGTPKGTLIHHRGLVNYLSWCLRNYPVKAGCGALVHSSISFDLTITGLFAPLLTGRAVRLVAEDFGVAGLGDALQSEQDLSLVKLTPSHLRLINQQLEPSQAAGRTRALIIGGENLLAETLEFWRAAAPETLLINEYGPTETVVGCCVYVVQPDTPHSGAVPIGRPIANTELYILDAWMQPVPIGVTGELYIAGAGVARGYLNRPDLTAERFVPHPFSVTPGQRLYRTGDRACYQPDGTIDYLGRDDEQVKLRGVRIELGEIEGALLLHPKVEAAAAALKSTPDGEPRLVAYIVPQARSDEQAQPSAPKFSLADELRSFLKERLPQNMLPTAYVMLAALPLTSNGKLDRQALPQPEQEDSRSRRNFLAPRTEVERLLADIYAQTLGLETVGINDDFFELGGDSILCFQVIYKAHQAGVRLTLHQLFNFRTIATLSANLDGASHVEEAEQGLVTGAIPLTPIQHWFFEQPLPAPQHFNQAVLLELGERPNRSLLEQAIRHLARHHDALRLRFIRGDAGWQQFNDEEMGGFELQYVNLSAVPRERQREKIAQAATEAQASLNLAEGPLMRTLLFDCGDEQPARLLWIVHHLAVDAVSWRIMLGDLLTAYQQLQKGAAVRLLPKTTSFKRWAELLKSYAQGQELAGELSYWLADTPTPLPPLPVNHHSGPNDHESSRTVSLALSAEETRLLLHDLPRVYGTQINEVLLTALAMAVSGWTGHPLVLVELEGHGREEVFEGADLSRTVGWFTSVYPVVLKLEESQSPTQALAAIQAELRQVPNRGIGYGLLRYLRDDPATSEKLQHRAQAELSFNYLGQLDASLSESELFKLSDESPGRVVDGRAPRRYLLDVISHVIKGQLHVTWVYSEHRHQRATISEVAESYIQALRSLISQARTTPTRSQALISGEAAASLGDRRLAEMLLVSLKPEGRLRPLFCLHPSGGMATVYSDLVRHLDTEQPIYGFQSKGWYPGEQPADRVEEMAAQYLEVIRSIQPQGPYLLAGWSSGAIIAFEIAQQFHALGDKVALLASIDQPPPDPFAPEQTDATLLEAMFGGNYPELAKRLEEVAPDERLVFALEHAKVVGLVPEHTELAQARRFFHIFRVTHAAVRKYEPRLYPGGLTLFRAEQQPDTDWAQSPTFGWSKFVRGPVEVHYVPGHHDNIIVEPYVKELGSKLRQCLAKAQAEESGQSR